MSRPVLIVENLSKQYRLGQVGTGTISHDLNRFWYRIRGKEDPYLEVGNVNVRSSAENPDYVWALRDVSFQLNRGEVLGVIGKNGAGKSTLLKVLSRITSPTTGSIHCKGRISSLLEVGTGFHPELTGRENIFLNGAILGMQKKEIAAKLDEIVDFSGCAAYLDTPVKRYSSGMLVRLGFAVAAHLESEILVVDEVLAVGDIEFQKKCIGKMQDVSSSGRTILFVSHNMQSVQNLCQNGLLLEDGQAVFYGPVGETISRYLKSGESADQYDLNLRDMSDRSGSGEVTFEHLQIRVNEQPSNKLVIGDNLKFKLKIKGHREVRMKMAIHLYRHDEIVVSNIENIDSSFTIDPFVGEKEFEIDFGEIMLYPDRYKIGLWMGGVASEETFDYFRVCCEVEVVDGSKLVMRNIPKNSGVVYFIPKWTQLS
jgi:lipopolysaccharide transport system ATP-binding protein